MAKHYGVIKFILAIKEEILQDHKKRQEEIHNYYLGGGNDWRHIDAKHDEYVNGLVKAMEIIKELDKK